MISMNQELVALQLEKSQSFPMAAVEQHRFPEYGKDDNDIHDNTGSLNPAHQTLFQSQMSRKDSRSPSGSKQIDPNIAKLEKSGLVFSLKKQVNELRKENEKSQQEISDLQKTTKVCVYNELDIQLETYSDECKRMREKLEESVKKQLEQEKDIKKLHKQLNSKQSGENDAEEKDEGEVLDIRDNDGAGLDEEKDEGEELEVGENDATGANEEKDEGKLLETRENNNNEDENSIKGKTDVDGDQGETDGQGEEKSNKEPAAGD